jgi:hypothetical protein
MLIAVALVLTGCDQQPVGQEAAGPAVSDEATAAPDAGARVAQAGPDFKLDQPIPREDIQTTLRLASPPVYRAANDTLVLSVEVGNQGKSALVGQGEMPVQLGITLAGPDGVDKEPGRRNFVRARLPLVQPGDTTVVNVQVPAAEILGLALNAELVQERAGWFGRNYKQPILEIGTFQRCGDADKTLCDASGQPVQLAAPASPAEAQPPASRQG